MNDEHETRAEYRKELENRINQRVAENNANRGGGGNYHQSHQFTVLIGEMVINGHDE